MEVGCKLHAPTDFILEETSASLTDW